MKSVICAFKSMALSTDLYNSLQKFVSLSSYAVAKSFHSRLQQTAFVLRAQAAAPYRNSHRRVYQQFATRKKYPHFNQRRPMRREKQCDERQGRRSLGDGGTVRRTACRESGPGVGEWLDAYIGRSRFGQLVGEGEQSSASVENGHKS